MISNSQEQFLSWRCMKTAHPQPSSFFSMEQDHVTSRGTTCKLLHVIPIATAKKTRNRSSQQLLHWFSVWTAVPIVPTDSGWFHHAQGTTPFLVALSIGSRPQTKLWNRAGSFDLKDMIVKGIRTPWSRCNWFCSKDVLLPRTNRLEAQQLAIYWMAWSYVMHIYSVPTNVYIYIHILV